MRPHSCLLLSLSLINLAFQKISVKSVGEDVVELEPRGGKSSNVPIQGQVINNHSVVLTKYGSKCSPCATRPKPKELVEDWREVDLGEVYAVTGADVSAIKDGVVFSLEEVVLEVGMGERSTKPCGSFSRGPDDPPAVKVSVVCSPHVKGRVVLIKFKMRVSFESIGHIKISIDVNAERKRALIEEQLVQSRGKNTKQVGNYAYHISDFAADGNLDTCAVAHIGGSSAWWQIDMERVRKITRVQIYTCDNKYHAETLNRAWIGLGTTPKVVKKMLKKCQQIHVPVEVLEPGVWINIPCSNPPVEGRYLSIMGLEHPSPRPGEIALAEIKIFEAKGTPPDPPPPADPSVAEVSLTVIRDRVRDNTWFRISLLGSTVAHIGTIDQKATADMAVDGNPGTYSLSGDGSRAPWLRVELPYESWIIGIEVTTSPIPLESNLLQEFEVEVNGRILGLYKNLTDIPPETVIVLIADKSILGKTITIRRLEKARFQPLLLAIAEIVVYSDKKKSRKAPLPISPLNGKRLDPRNRPVSQLHIYTDHVPKYALDSDPDTCAVSFPPKGQNSIAWWMVDLESMVDVVGVQILSCNNNFSAELLGNSRVGVSRKKATDWSYFVLCSEVLQSVAVVHVEPSTWLNLPCLAPIKGRVVMVARTKKAFKAEAIALAEINIYVAEELTPLESPHILDPKEIQEQLEANKWFEVTLAGFTSRQSETLGRYMALYAYDGDPLRKSLSCNPCRPSTSSSPAWWRIDFESPLYVAAVQITSSQNVYEANYLQDFTVEVGTGENRNATEVATYRSWSRVPVSSAINLRCREDISGSFLLIKRLPVSYYLPQYLSIGELKVYAVTQQFDAEVEITLKVNSLKKWKEIETTRMRGNSLVFNCDECGLFRPGFGLEGVVTLWKRSTIAGVSIFLSETYDPSQLRDFVVFVTIKDKLKKYCSHFKRGVTKIKKNKISLICLQPIVGIGVRLRHRRERSSLQIVNIFVLTLVEKKQEKPDSLSRSSMKALQSGMAHNRFARLAIDGNGNTWSQTVSEVEGFLGWWKAMLDRPYEVYGVTLTGAPYSYDAYLLQKFEVRLIMIPEIEKFCATYNEAPFAPREEKYIPCANPKAAIQVLIRKLPESFRPDSMILAEVEIHAKQTTDDVVATESEGSRAGRPHQIGVFQFNMALFAVDGEPSTCAVACNPCDGSTDNGFGWWQFDFGREVTISSLDLQTCTVATYSNFLNDIVVGVTNTSVTSWEKLVECASFSREGSLPTLFWLKIRCREPLTGRYLVILRKKSATFHPHTIAVAEIRAYNQYGGLIKFFSDSLEPYNAGEAVIIGKESEYKWMVVNILSMKVDQTTTLQNTNYATYAIDNTDNTYSYGRNPQGVGWWKITFGVMINVVAIQLKTSHRELESHLLHEFRVLVTRGRVLIGECAAFRSRTYLPPSTLISLVCVKTLKGDSLRIERLPGSFDASAIAIAEVIIYTTIRD